jgi:hypothetical protein
MNPVCYHHEGCGFDHENHQHPALVSIASTTATDLAMLHGGVN